jgi:hypothetical protein
MKLLRNLWRVKLKGCNIDSIYMVKVTARFLCEYVGRYMEGDGAKLRARVEEFEGGAKIISDNNQTHITDLCSTVQVDCV